MEEEEIMRRIAMQRQWDEDLVNFWSCMSFSSFPTFLEFPAWFPYDSSSIIIITLTFLFGVQENVALFFLFHFLSGIPLNSHIFFLVLRLKEHHGLSWVFLITAIVRVFDQVYRFFLNYEHCGMLIKIVLGT